MSQDAWLILNKKVVTYIKMVVSDEILVDLKGLVSASEIWAKLLVSASEIWAKLKATYENSTFVNQVHLM